MNISHTATYSKLLPSFSPRIKKFHNSSRHDPRHFKPKNATLKKSFVHQMLFHRNGVIMQFFISIMITLLIGAHQLSICTMVLVIITPNPPIFQRHLHYQLITCLSQIKKKNLNQLDSAQLAKHRQRTQ